MGAFGMSTSTGGGSKAGHVEFEGKITWFVVLCATIAATGGLMFGCDIGISGMCSCLCSFFLYAFYVVSVFAKIQLVVFLIWLMKTRCWINTKLSCHCD